MLCHKPTRVSSTSTFSARTAINNRESYRTSDRWWYYTIIVNSTHFFSFWLPYHVEKVANHCNSTLKKTSMRLLISHSKFTRIFVESPALQTLGRAVWVILFGITILGVQFAYRLSNVRDVFSKLQILDALKDTHRLQYIIIIFLHGLGLLTCSGIDEFPSFPGASTIPSPSGYACMCVYIQQIQNGRCFHSCSLARAPSWYFFSSHSVMQLSGSPPHKFVDESKIFHLKELTREEQSANDSDFREVVLYT